MYYFLLIISVFAVIITVYDKIAARTLPSRRIPERLLMLTGLLGGAAAEYVTMLIIRHKTRHNKFMMGLPLMMVLHMVLIAIYHFYF